MKKVFILCVFMLILNQICAFAEVDYSQMDAPLPKVCIETEYEISDDIETEDKIALFSGKSYEETIYDTLNNVLSPANIVNYTASKETNGAYYVDIKIPVNYARNDSLGDIQYQFDLIAEGINEILSDYMAHNPEYFYILPDSYSWSGTVTGRYLNITFRVVIGYDFPDYTGTKASMRELKNKYDSLMNVINSAAQNLMFEGMTDLDKLLLAHDYITDNCVYYKTVKDGYYYYGDGYSFNSYGVLVNKKGVCQGYAYAYPALLKAMGYPIENIRQVSSEALNHMWNFVKLDNKWYHVDVTWDDPTVSNSQNMYDMNDLSYQYTYHNYFLISNNTNGALRNKSFDMDILGTDILPSAAQDVSYENGYIFNIRSRNMPGNIKYSEGIYHMYTGKLYSNRENGIYYEFNSLKAPEYAVSQPCKLLRTEDDKYLFGTLGSIEHFSGNILFYIFGGNQSNPSEKQVCMYVCFYDKDGTLLSVDKARKYIQFGSNTLSSYEYTVPQNAYMFKLICLDDENIKPLINTPVISE